MAFAGRHLNHSCDSWWFCHFFRYVKLNPDLGELLIIQFIGFTCLQYSLSYHVFPGLMHVFLDNLVHFLISAAISLLNLLLVVLL